MITVLYMLVIVLKHPLEHNLEKRRTPLVWVASEWGPERPARFWGAPPSRPLFCVVKRSNSFVCKINEWFYNLRVRRRMRAGAG